jgi:hypothetical protein
MSEKRIEGIGAKPPAPELIKPSIAKAKARTQRRSFAPFIALERDEAGVHQWEWPFEDTSDDWLHLVVDAFGTRSANIAHIFVDQLAALAAKQWDEPTGKWIPDAQEVSALIAIVSACRPKNEAQAAMAAQMAAVHLMTMRVGSRLGEHPWDTKMIGAFSRLARTYAIQMDTMQSLKGKRRSVKQHITVTQEKHIHNHQHVHLEGGTDIIGNQPHEARRTSVTEKCDTLPSPESSGVVVWLPSDEGQAGLSPSRREKSGRAQG